MIILPFFVIIILTLLLDQFSKLVVRSTLVEGQSIPVIPNVFHLTYINNPGAAFGLFKHQTLLFIVVTTLIIGLLLFYYIKYCSKSRISRFGLGLLIGGAIGNLIDRIRFGEVVDFLDFQIWPIFNLADTAIVVGIGLLIIELFYFEKNEDVKGEKVDSDDGIRNGYDS